MPAKIIDQRLHERIGGDGLLGGLLARGALDARHRMGGGVARHAHFDLQAQALAEMLA